MLIALMRFRLTNEHVLKIISVFIIHKSNIPAEPFSYTYVLVWI